MHSKITFKDYYILFADFLGYRESSVLLNTRQSLTEQQNTGQQYRSQKGATGLTLLRNADSIEGNFERKLNKSVNYCMWRESIGAIETNASTAENAS